MGNYEYFLWLLGAMLLSASLSYIIVVLWVSNRPNGGQWISLSHPLRNDTRNNKNLKCYMCKSDLGYGTLLKGERVLCKDCGGKSLSIIVKGLTRGVDISPSVSVVSSTDRQFFEVLGDQLLYIPLNKQESEKFAPNISNACLRVVFRAK